MSVLVHSCVSNVSIGTLVCVCVSSVSIGTLVLLLLLLLFLDSELVIVFDAR